MAISVFQVQSPLSQVTRERTNEYLKTVGSAVGEELVRVDLDEFEKAPFALVFVASGGSEGIFKEGYERICKKALLYTYQRRKQLPCRQYGNPFLPKAAG